MHRRHWEALQEQLMAQVGLVTVRQAYDAGLDRQTLRWAVHCGDLVRVRRGVLGSPGVALTAERAQLAAVLAAGDDAALSHLAAGGRHAFPRIRRGLLEISVRRRRAARLVGVTAHSAPDLSALDVTAVDGIPCTTMARTVVDLTTRVHPDVLRRIVAHVERVQRPAGLSEIVAAAERVSPKRRPDIAPLRLLVARMGGGEPGLDLTPRYLAAFERCGVRAPALELPVTWGGRVYVLDASWVPEQVDVEFDDDWSHATVAGSHADKERDRLARRAGWEVERVTPETDIDAFVRHLSDLLEQRSRRSA